MPVALPYQLLADMVLALHVAIVAFVVGGLVLILVGNILKWRWVNSWWFRVLHLGSIGVVVAEAWIGMVCPLTTLEMWLRMQADQAIYSGSFIEYWLSRLLFYEAPEWVFTLGYSLFGFLVLLSWFCFPPERSHRKGSMARGH